MSWDETTEESTGSALDGGPTRESGLALVVLWCRTEPWRTGELLSIGPGDRQVYVFGRGEEAPADNQQLRLRLLQQRPARNIVTPPLACPKLSRVHLRIQRVDARTLAVENQGKRALFVRGREVQQALLRAPIRGQSAEGSVLRIDGELALLLVERDAQIAPLAYLPPAPMPGFGSPCNAGLVGESPVLWALRDQLALVARDGGAVLVHGGPGAMLSEVANAIHRRNEDVRATVSIDLSTLPREVHARTLFGESGVFATQREDVVLHALEALDPSVAESLGRVLIERRVPSKRQAKPLELRVVGATTAPELLHGSLRGAFTHLVRAPSLAEQREDLPFIALALARTIAQRDSQALSAPDWEGLSPALAELLPQLPLEGGMAFLRAVVTRSLALSNGHALVVPPELDVLGPPMTSPPLDPSEPKHAERRAAQGESQYQSLSPLPKDLPQEVAEGLPSLTRAERNVLRELAGNKTSREIGQTLFISVRTVQNHRARICDKLGLRGNNALLGVALRLRDHLGPSED